MLDPEILDCLQQWDAKIVGSNKRTGLLWILSFISLIAGGFLAGQYVGGLIALGFCLIVWAAAEEIKKQIYPVGLLALSELRQKSKRPD